MANNNGVRLSYANEPPPSVTGGGDRDADMTSDPASSSFFFNDYKKLASKMRVLIKCEYTNLRMWNVKSANLKSANTYMVRMCV